MQGFQVATAKTDGFVGFRDEQSSDVWDRDGRHIEGYLNGCMYKFIWSMFIRAGW